MKLFCITHTPHRTHTHTIFLIYIYIYQSIIWEIFWFNKNISFINYLQKKDTTNSMYHVYFESMQTHMGTHSPADCSRSAILMAEANCVNWLLATFSLSVTKPRSVSLNEASMSAFAAMKAEYFLVLPATVTLPSVAVSSAVDMALMLRLLTTLPSTDTEKNTFQMLLLLYAENTSFSTNTTCGNSCY